MRTRIFLFLLIALTICTSQGNAQFPLFQSNTIPFIGGNARPLPGCQDCGDAFGAAFGASARVGYEVLGLSATAPVRSSFTVIPGFGTVNEFNFQHMDVSLRDAGAWIGSINVFAGLPYGAKIYGEALGSLQKSATAVTDFQGDVTNIVFSSYASPWEWTARKFQFWSLDGAIGLPVWSVSEFLIGLRVKNISFDLRDPRNAAGSIAGRLGPVFGTTYENQFADFNARLWIPYIGIKGNGGYFKWSVLASPLGWANISMPVRWQTVDPLGNEVSDSYYTYTLNYAAFLEGNAEYNWNIGPNYALTMWSRLNWFGAKGTANLDSSFPNPPGTNLFGQSGSIDTQEGKVRMYSWSFGFAADLFF